MANQSFMDMIRSFLGLDKGAPRNDFRNPLWGTDDDNYDDELFTRRRNGVQHYDPADFHREMTEMSRHMEEVFKSFGGMGSIFGDMGSFNPDNHRNPIAENEKVIDDEDIIEGNIRDYYLNPDYSNNLGVKEDNDLDGKVSSNDISNFLKRYDPDNKNNRAVVPFQENFGPGKSFFKTVITTKVTKPDGTVETRRIIKDQNGVVEETTTENEPNPKNTNNININVFPANEIISDIAPGLASFLKIFY